MTTLEDIIQQTQHTTPLLYSLLLANDNQIDYLNVLLKKYFMYYITIFQGNWASCLTQCNYYITYNSITSHTILECQLLIYKYI